MQADMYNLYPAIGEVNGRRSNYSMAIIEGEKREFGKCDIEIKSRKVEPKENIEQNWTITPALGVLNSDWFNYRSDSYK